MVSNHTTGNVINLSIQHSKVPDLMKTACIKGLYKQKGCRYAGKVIMQQLQTGYRPISILLIFVKILEQIVNFQI